MEDSTIDMKLFGWRKRRSFETEVRSFSLKLWIVQHINAIYISSFVYDFDLHYMEFFGW